MKRSRNYRKYSIQKYGNSHAEKFYLNHVIKYVFAFFFTSYLLYLKGVEDWHKR